MDISLAKLQIDELIIKWNTREIEDDVFTQKVTEIIDGNSELAIYALQNQVGSLKRMIKEKKSQNKKQ